MKKIAPIIVTIIVCAWASLYAAGLFAVMKFDATIFERIFVLLAALGFAGFFFAMVWTLIIRLREINKEEKDDDISKY